MLALLTETGDVVRDAAHRECHEVEMARQLGPLTPGLISLNLWEYRQAPLQARR
ncbi:hypothetical protein FuraDRAFT_2159 [Pseudogulbenkiania ferrooxidans 2002]|uniref:Uncharacterized protein n=1 Tax=Pseudogulbenkiania ferrooxidans 2002 TaxID=279714 RepID=B9Z474_9NEIS|nr:hypothetical protein FuraDRAFT_2159 [Pseudogulbenkiania ferrooxidans 2002]